MLLVEIIFIIIFPLWILLLQRKVFKEFKFFIDAIEMTNDSISSLKKFIEDKVQELKDEPRKQEDDILYEIFDLEHRINELKKKAGVHEPTPILLESQDKPRSNRSKAALKSWQERRKKTEIEGND